MIEPFRNAKPEQIVAKLRAMNAYRETTFDIAELDRATASDLGNVLSRVHEHFAGKLTLTGVLLETLDRKDIARTYTSRSGQAFIRLNRLYFVDRRALLYVLGMQYSDGYIAGGDPVHVLLHEAAHVLQDSPQIGLSRALGYVRVHPVRADQLSRRATEAPDESLAEAFAKVLRAPFDDLNPWLKGFREALDEDIRAVGGIIIGYLP